MAAPSSWMLDKLTGTWAPKPNSGPHKQKECMPLMVLLPMRVARRRRRSFARSVAAISCSSARWC